VLILSCTVDEWKPLDFGDDSDLLFRPNVTSTTLGDAIRKGFLNEVSDNGLVHRTAPTS
jgi:hypothetical protein